MGHPYRPAPKNQRDGFVQLSTTLTVRRDQILHIEDRTIVLAHGHRVPLTIDNENAVREVLE